jgi:mannose-6-phosphate isomerase-like protein (cupin superfamily)
MTVVNAKRYFVVPEDTETMVFDFGWIQWTACPRVTGGTRCAPGQVYLLPGWGHETHVHANEEEVLQFIQGTGIQKVGDEEMEIRPGLTVDIPPNVPHSTANNGVMPVEFFAVYSPPGPEDALREMAGVRVIPAGQPLTSPSYIEGFKSTRSTR